MYNVEKSIKNMIEYKYLSKEENNKNIVYIGYGIDDNYARCASTSIVSFCINNPEKKFVFYIMASNLSMISKKKFKILAERYSIDIIIYKIDTSYFEKLPTRINFPTPTYYRFILPLLLKKLDKVFYIDADVICVNDASEMFNSDFEDNVIIAVPDTEESNEERNKALMLKKHIYFNAGVLGINIKKWNESCYFNELIDILMKDPKKFYMLDQDALNIIFKGKVKYLSRKFNWFNGFYEWEKDSIRNKKIILLHFTSTPKPWDLGWKVHSMCNKYNANLYNNYELLTPWANTPLKIPNTYKKMRLYARDLKRNGYYLGSIKWYLKYLMNKIKYLIKK